MHTEEREDGEKAGSEAGEQAPENDQAGSHQGSPEDDIPTVMENATQPLTRGQIVDGVIVQLDEEGALVDVGTKSEGHIPAGEMGATTHEDGRPLAVGDRVSVFVVRPEDEAGNPVLSKRMADYESTWHRLTQAYRQGAVISAMVTDRVKGGLVVDLGVRGFLPASHVRTRSVHALDRLVGQSMKVKIIEVDRARKRVVVSHKDALEEERQKRREQTLASLQENQVCRGVVRRLTDYGAFVDLGGVDGLLHITEISWTRIDHPREVLRVGDKIDVIILRFDREQNRISLGRKQILPDPWEEVRDQFKVGQVVSGTVSRVVPFGAFVKLHTGIEAIIPNAELPGGRGTRAQDVLSVGHTVEAKVVNIRAAERRISLSLRQMQQAEERRELKEYMQRQEAESRVTIGDLYGNMLSEAGMAPREESEVEGELAENIADSLAEDEELAQQVEQQALASEMEEGPESELAGDTAESEALASREEEQAPTTEGEGDSDGEAPSQAEQGRDPGEA